MLNILLVTAIVLASASARAGGPRSLLLALYANRPAGFAAIAQLVEHVIRNDGVGGSSPSCGTSALISSDHHKTAIVSVRFARDAGLTTMHRR
jgi:hypothetical protein